MGSNTVKEVIEAELKRTEEKKVGSNVTEKKLKEEIGVLRSAVAKLIVEQKAGKAALEKLVPPPFFPLEIKQELRKLLEKCFVQDLPIHITIRKAKKFFKDVERGRR